MGVLVPAIPATSSVTAPPVFRARKRPR